MLEQSPFGKGYINERFQGEGCFGFEAEADVGGLCAAPWVQLQSPAWPCATRMVNNTFGAGRTLFGHCLGTCGASPTPHQPLYCSQYTPSLLSEL